MTDHPLSCGSSCSLTSAFGPVRRVETMWEAYVYNCHGVYLVSGGWHAQVKVESKLKFSGW